MAQRYDVVLFGATGVTGREVARHLARRAPALGVSWAVAGRAPDRVAAAVAGLDSEPAAVLTADTRDRDSIDRLAAAAGVLVDLVGPYAQHGEVVYEACIRHGTTELDLTGELDWLASMIGVHGQEAIAAGARIVPVCGFESLPFDLGARFCAEAAHARTGEPVVEVDVALTTTVRAVLRRPADAVSGGTWASAVGMLRRGSRRAATDAHLLDPPTLDPPAQDPAWRRHDLRARRHAGTGVWLAPMVPSPVLNPPVVHRSAALARADGDGVFSDRFRYREGVAVPGPLGPAVAVAMAGAGAALGGVIRAPDPVRRTVADVLGRVGPRPGEGPRAEDLDRWSYRLDVTATTEGGARQRAVVDAVGHPGYRSTAMVVAEAALLLADPSTTVPARSGFLTPATALGTEHLDRFAEARLTFRLL